MRFLLDTHVLLWMRGAPQLLSDEARRFVEDDGSELLLSAASVWEVAIKHAARKLDLPEPPSVWLARVQIESAVVSLAMTEDDALVAAALPAHHRDPFDRMLVAQAMRHDVALMSADPMLLKYAARVTWAGRQPL